SKTADIRRVAEQIRGTYTRIHRLVNNAGMLPNAERETSADGWELTFAINHMSYFTLTHELLPLLKQSPGARVVNVASEAHRSGRFEADNLQLTQGYNTFKA
ncbi:SDR family NAD(P)-dependent oxidoreductase, partial [Arthrospira platensis SPKY1]|nr:SDR family NAD(P)-dependent oxidoreductase [Arthrospira platensis SPKY1]